MQNFLKKKYDCVAKLEIPAGLGEGSDQKHFEEGYGYFTQHQVNEGAENKLISIHLSLFLLFLSLYF